MDFQELCELADREIRLSTYDRPVMARALTEANGVTAHAHQIYWRLRATAIQEEAKKHPGTGNELYIRELKARLDAEQRRRKLRSDLIGWTWVVVCFVSLIGTFIFFRMAKVAFYRGAAGFYGYAVTGVVCVVLAVVAYAVCKRDAGEDPFAD
jgi:hypothetical protein